MGLGGPKKRLKLSNDPNNTAWSRSATKYGRKILQSHGWMPGELLGAIGAPYSNLRSTASASHIRITLKDDNLGLGANHEAVHDNSKATGLDVFQDLLGRLNGRTTTDLAQHRACRSHLRSSSYIDQRWGKLRFVSGGLLVGHEMRDLVMGDQDAPNRPQQASSQCSENGKLPEAKKSQEARSETSKRKKQQKRKTSGDECSIEETSKGNDWSVVGTQSPRHTPVKPECEFHTSPKDMFDQIQMGKVRKHTEDANRKVKRRRVKRDASHSSRLQVQAQSPDLRQLPDPDIRAVAPAMHFPRGTNTSNRVSQGLGADRLAVRHRYIQHKKLCMMDNKALNEILMIKP